MTWQRIPPSLINEIASCCEAGHRSLITCHRTSNHAAGGCSQPASECFRGSGCSKERQCWFVQSSISGNSGCRSSKPKRPWYLSAAEMRGRRLISRFEWVMKVSAQ